MDTISEWTPRFLASGMLTSHYHHLAFTLEARNEMMTLGRDPRCDFVIPQSVNNVGECIALF